MLTPPAGGIPLAHHQARREGEETRMAHYYCTNETCRQHQIGCRWCDYDTPPSLTHVLAMGKLLAHVQEHHPAEYKETVTRPKRQDR